MMSVHATSGTVRWHRLRERSCPRRGTCRVPFLQGYVVCMIEHADGTAAATRLAYGAGWLFYEGWGTEEVRMSQTRWVIANSTKQRVGTRKSSETVWQWSPLQASAHEGQAGSPAGAWAPSLLAYCTDMVQNASGKQAVEGDSQELRGLLAVRLFAGLCASVTS